MSVSVCLNTPTDRSLIAFCFCRRSNADRHTHTPLSADWMSARPARSLGRAPPRQPAQAFSIQMSDCYLYLYAYISRNGNLNNIYIFKCVRATCIGEATGDLLSTKSRWEWVRNIPSVRDDGVCTAHFSRPPHTIFIAMFYAHQAALGQITAAFR